MDLFVRTKDSENLLEDLRLEKHNENGNQEKLEKKITYKDKKVFFLEKGTPTSQLPINQREISSKTATLNSRQREQKTKRKYKPSFNGIG